MLCLIFAAMQSQYKFLNEYFDKILVLTLPRLTDRIDYFKKNFEGLNYDFFYGLDKESTSLNELKEKGLYNILEYQKFYKKNKEISAGMLCCSLSHIKMYEYILEKGFKKTLILEDDAIPVLKQLSKFPDIIKQLPKNWELFYLGYEKNEKLGLKQKINRFLQVTFPHHVQLKLTREIFRNYYPVQVSPLIAKAGFHDCTHAYAVTAEGAGKLSQYGKPIRFHPDNLLAYLNCTGSLNGYISQVKLFNQLSAFINKMDSQTSS